MTDETQPTQTMIPHPSRPGRKILSIAASYGKLTVLPNTWISRENASYVTCKCDCGRIREVRTDKLRTGRISACSECNYTADRELRRKKAAVQYSLTLQRATRTEKRIIQRVEFSIEALKEAAQLSAQQMIATGVSPAMVMRYLAIPTSVIPNP